jgi:hypothetical protein
MEWMKRSVTPERELQIELAVRSMPPREAALYRACINYQELLQQSIWEIMRLESLLEDQQAQAPSPHP